MLVSMAAIGCGAGSSMGIFNPVVIEVVGLEKYGPVLAAYTIILAIGFLCLGPFVGKDLYQVSILHILYIFSSTC